MSEISSAQELRNACLTLYAFHLCTDISKGTKQAASKASQLWQQLMGLGNTLKIRELQFLHQKLICYQSAQYQPSAEDQLDPGEQNLLLSREDSLDFQLAAQINHRDLEFNGSLAPFRIHDTYAIDLTLFSATPITLGQISHLNPQGLLLPPHIQASLGQTLLLYAEVDSLRKEDRAIADACVAQLFHNQTMPEFLAEGKLLGSSIFEYDTLSTDSSQQRHALVWLNHNSLAPEVDEVSERLLYILLCRHKVLYAYEQSRWCDCQAKQIYSELDQNIVRNFSHIAQAPDHLQQFQTLLREQLPQKAFEYARHLRDLSDHITTIQTNLENYQSQLAKLSKLLGNDLTFLQQFRDRAQNKFLRQIQVDREFLAPGQALFQQLTETIRGLTELEQTESDRRLERTIQVVGVGLGVGAIFGSSSAFIDRPWKPPFSPNADVHPFLSSLLVSLSAALLAGFATWWLTRHKKRLP
jgi:hypothetical protein